MSTLVDLYCCEQCSTIRALPVTTKPDTRKTMCYVCRASRMFMPITIRNSPTSQIIIEKK